MNNDVEIKQGERIDDLHRNGYLIIQNTKMFCFGIDAVLLSGFAQVKKGENMIDLGTGTGVIPILLEAKTKGNHFTGIEIQKESEEEQFDIFIENNEISNNQVIEYLKDIKDGISKNSEEINRLITNNLKENWSLNRISKINLSLIKLAIYEMIYKSLPYKVAINEVVELAKKYADESAPVFINGILASVVKEKNLNGEKNEA